MTIDHYDLDKVRDDCMREIGARVEDLRFELERQIRDLRSELNSVERQLQGLRDAVYDRI